MKKIVAIGGGTGLSTLLKGLKYYPFELSAIVTMTDDGLSTGRLRKTFGILPPGDIRKSIVALAKKEDLLTSLFEYRFHRGKGLSGHSLGNLLILALEKITGSFRQAVASASEILAIKGKVIPSTLQNIDLVAEFVSGKRISGERKIFLTGAKNPIKKIWLNKSKVQANFEAVKAIQFADVILIGPGSLWTSVIPNFLIKEITQTIISNKKATKIYLANVSSERGETQGYTIDDHVQKLVDHSHKNLFQYVLVNNKIIKKSQEIHRLGEINNITTNKSHIGVYKVIKKDLININNPLYHDPQKTAKVIWEITHK